MKAHGNDVATNSGVLMPRGTASSWKGAGFSDKAYGVTAAQPAP